MLGDAADALRHTSSYHVLGMLDPGLEVDLVIVHGGSSGTVTSHGVSWHEITIAGHTWFQGAALWAATQPATAASALGDRWVLVQSASSGFGLAPRFAHLDISIPGVVFALKPGLQNVGEVNLGGRRVVELRSKKDIYDVLATGTPFPVRWLELENPGPTGKPCGITIDGFGAPVTVVAPSNPVPGPTD